MELYSKETKLWEDYMIKSYMIIKKLHDEETTW